MSRRVQSSASHFPNTSGRRPNHNSEAEDCDPVALICPGPYPTTPQSAKRRKFTEVRLGWTAPTSFTCVRAQPKNPNRKWSRVGKRAQLHCKQCPASDQCQTFRIAGNWLQQTSKSEVTSQVTRHPHARTLSRELIRPRHQDPRPAACTEGLQIWNSKPVDCITKQAGKAAHKIQQYGSKLDEANLGPCVPVLERQMRRSDERQH